MYIICIMFQILPWSNLPLIHDHQIASFSEVIAGSTRWRIPRASCGWWSNCHGWGNRIRRTRWKRCASCPPWNIPASCPGCLEMGDGWRWRMEISWRFRKLGDGEWRCLRCLGSWENDGEWWEKDGRRMGEWRGLKLGRLGSGNPREFLFFLEVGLVKVIWFAYSPFLMCLPSPPRYS